MVTWVGYKSIILLNPPHGGKIEYSLQKMVRLSMDAVFRSLVPLYIGISLGILMLLALIEMIHVLSF